jgi:hypothetical protein
MLAHRTWTQGPAQPIHAGCLGKKHPWIVLGYNPGDKGNCIPGKGVKWGEAPLPELVGENEDQTTFLPLHW